MMNTFFMEGSIIQSTVEAAVATVTITDKEVTDTEEYKKAIADLAINNGVWTTKLAEVKAANAGMTDAVAEEVTKRLTGLKGLETDTDVLNRIKQKMLDERKAEAKAKAMEELQEYAYTAKASYDAMFPSAPAPAVVSTPAPVPQAPAESRMTMSERKQMIREIVGTGSGTTQFRRHCSTTASANEARALIERWRSLGYITGGQKAELRAEVNAAAWLAHCGVTATR